MLLNIATRSQEIESGREDIFPGGESQELGVDDH